MDFVLPSGQGDLAIIDDSQLDPPGRPVAKRLYYLWETQQWAVGALDFERDRHDWARLTEEQRAMLVKSMAPFFVGEERVASVVPIISLSAEDDQEAAFLATQGADEARHTQFFERFWREVFVPDESANEAALADARARCNDSFAELFDQRANQALDRLRTDPRNTDAKVEVVTIYHIIVESLLGLTAMHFVLDYFQKHAILPAIRDGVLNVQRDEHRHVAWGTWFLREKCHEKDRYGFIVQKTLMELLPVAASIIVEGGHACCSGLDKCEFLDYPSEQVNYFALGSLARRLKVIGGATDEVQRFVASGAWRASRLL